MAKPDIDTPDEILVVAAMAGDFDAFDSLAVRYRQGVVRIARSFVGRDDAEDVAQETLLIAFKALPTLEEPAKFPAWLHAIARHRAIRFDSREHRRRKMQVALDKLLLERMPALARPVSELEAIDELQSVLDRISAGHALVLRLHFLDEMPLKRIASFLGVSVTAVKWRVHRGKELMRQGVKRYQRREPQWKRNRN